MKEWFLEKENPERVAYNQINKVVCDKNQSIEKTSESGIPFVRTHHRRLQSLVNWLDLLSSWYSREFKKFTSSHLRWYHTEVLEK